MTPEAKVRNPTVSWATAHGIDHQRMSFRPGVKQAFPDDLFLFAGGMSCWIEFKREGKEPTPLQMHRINRLNERGHVARWFDNTAEAIEFLEQMLFIAKQLKVTLSR